MPSIRLNNPIREEFRIADKLRSVNRRSQERLPTVVTTIRVNPTIWAVAMFKAYDDALRIEVISSEEVIVHNNRDWRRK